MSLASVKYNLPNSVQWLQNKRHINHVALTHFDLSMNSSSIMLRNYVRLDNLSDLIRWWESQPEPRQADSLWNHFRAGIQH